MRYLKPWAAVTVLMYISTFIGKLFLLQDADIGLSAPFSRSGEFISAFPAVCYGWEN